MIQLNEIHLFKNEIIGSPSYYLQEIKFHLQEKKLQELQISQKASEISKIPEIQNIINEIIQTIMKNGRYIVVGRDTTTNILPNAKVKLVLEADFKTRVYRRTKQLNVEKFEAIGKVFSDLLKRDMDSFDLVLEARKVAIIIDTTDLSIEQVVAKILSHVLWVKFSNHDMLHLIIFILFVFVYTLHAHFSEKIESNYSGQIKANFQVDSSDLQEESSTPQVKELTIQELIVLKNWELANYIVDKAYTQLIVKLEERHEFMN
ncbi:cytidylate kinase [Gigaspora margarita]|uniref:(d)CMP kinase n=1 Tax=Gigaspora margarita TaxID=4874 RepID=A0A8H4ARN3_GIGMA|nr:cytidylate kinase [Gigaspora margarita]